uniref:Mating pheromone Er-23 n=1 Tax=Euplotes raikovi TaxID=5938 RepID=MER23_EUPRA|nr:RecName: Full=Mating pheromone Er-23; AltName: Full=Euplomone R23 [Euplotes raikovi]1HA8_A Chain A, PHEROMONE [Euplotes raikovi]
GECEQCFSDGGDCTTCFNNGTGPCANCLAGYPAGCSNSDCTAFLSQCYGGC